MMPKALLLASVAAAALAACGGSSSAPAAAAPAEGARSAADECLAIAGAKRERRPDEPAKVTVKHILVKYAGARSAGPSVRRTREAACLRALEARENLERGAPFTSVVSSYSEEPGAATREGLVGAIERKDVVPPFADAAFELARGEVSHVVETPFGFHVILRSE
jgi:hypothetical protein